MNRPAACAMLCLLLAANAVAAEPEATEPRVQRTVVDDGGTRIEELRVRGQLQRVVVTPKGKARPYEVLTGDAATAPTDAGDLSRSAAGKRVWHVLSF